MCIHCALVRRSIPFPEETEKWITALFSSGILASHSVMSFFVAALAAGNDRSVSRLGGLEEARTGVCGDGRWMKGYLLIAISRSIELFRLSFFAVPGKEKVAYLHHSTSHVRKPMSSSHLYIRYEIRMIT